VVRKASPLEAGARTLIALEPSNKLAVQMSTNRSKVSDHKRTSDRGDARGAAGAGPTTFLRHYVSSVFGNVNWTKVLPKMNLEGEVVFKRVGVDQADASNLGRVNGPQARHPVLVPKVHFRIILLVIVLHPAAGLATIVLLTWLVGLSMTIHEDESEARSLTSSSSNESSNWLRGMTTYNAGLGCFALASSLPEKDALSPHSKVIHYNWCVFCRMVPPLMVFSIPIACAMIARSYPWEVLAASCLVSSMFTFINAVYLVAFAGCSVARLSASISCCSARTGGMAASTPAAPGRSPPMHWVVLPQYLEDVEVVSMALRSIRQSTCASSSIGIVLAMEEREPAAHDKAEELQRRFADGFSEMLIAYHPDGLPQDPSGKASNVAWAFRTLMTHLEGSRRAEQPALLTVADADSEFHAQYFERLWMEYSKASADERDLRIWQPLIFHLKNYHRQPGIVQVGSIFIAMLQLAWMSDPHVFHLPYSTYSMSIALAKRVGGWDPEWIAEDWHMGLKCFFGTCGQVEVQFLPLPVMNYTPEEDSWLATLQARWAQAKRHALGVSDLSYFFMALPLVISGMLAERKSSARKGAVSVSTVLLRSFGPLVRVVSGHVLAFLVVHQVFGICMRCVIMYEFPQDVTVRKLSDTITSFQIALFWSASVCCLLVFLMFVFVYELVKDRMDADEKPVSILFRNRAFHCVYLVCCHATLTGVFVVASGIAEIRASLKMLLSTTFEYEVASKPMPSKADGLT